MAGTNPPAIRPASAPPGAQRFGRYILIDRLGVGGMAEVFRALVIGPEQFQRVVVVKRILPHLSENPNFVRMFIDEATLCGRLSHPNIIQVHEFGKVDGSYFIAMEYVQGRTVSAILGRLAADNTHMPFTVAAEIARQAALGLGHAHALAAADGTPLQIIHRDVTPGNVMVAYSGVVKILDFGIARVAGEAQANTTDAGQVKGKSAYFAPEQLKSGPIDGRVDVWSLGIVLHEALTGRRLFKAANPLQTMELIQQMPIPTPSTVNPAVPAKLDEIVMRALERDRDWRYRTADEMAEALESFLIEQRYSSQELPKFLRALFHEEVTQEVTLPRDELQALVDSVGASNEIRSLADEVGPPTGGARAFGLEEESATPAVAPPVPAQGKAGRGRNLSFFVVVVVVALVAGGILFSQRAGRVPAVEVSAPHPAVGAAAVPASVPPPSATVRIALTSEPDGADVFRGGSDQSLGLTPLPLVLPRGSEMVELRIVKTGYVTAVLKVIPDADQPALVALAKAPSATPGASTRSKRGKVRNAIPIDPFAP